MKETKVNGLNGRFCESKHTCCVYLYYLSKHLLNGELYTKLNCRNYVINLNLQVHV